MATKHGKVVTHCEGLPPINSYNPLNIKDKLKTYLHYHKAYGHKAYQGGDLERSSDP